MKISKSDFTKTIRQWLVSYLEKMYAENYAIEVFVPESSLSRLSFSGVKSIPNSSSFEFKPDILGVLTNKNNGSVELVFLNRTMSAISLQEIGEILCYCRLANPKVAFICSPKGVPTEINLLLIDDDIQNRLLNYSDDRCVTVFKWNQLKSEVDLKSVFPMSQKEKFRIG
ncbi:MAG: hypothetical protein ACTSQE_17090 [Candidatus Heimdallarchaeaceae archaeon]